MITIKGIKQAHRASWMLHNRLKIAKKVQCVTFWRPQKGTSQFQTIHCCCECFEETKMSKIFSTFKNEQDILDFQFNK